MYVWRRAPTARSTTRATRPACKPVGFVGDEPASGDRGGLSRS
jgi:hypothetical protein